MLNFATAQDAATTAANSFNSANREQQIFNQSLEARINRLDTAWASFSATVGDTVLRDGIIVTTAGLEALTGGSESAVKNVGLLAPIFGILGIALVGVSGKFRGLVTSIVAQTTAATSSAIANRGLAVSMSAVFTAANLASKALRGLALATGVGAVFAGIGFAVEKLTSAISKNIQEQEKLDQYNQSNIDSLTKNKAQVDELLASYRNLAETREQRPLTPDAEREYLDVQNRLAEVFPALISYIDSTGQAHLKTSEAIDEQIKKTQQLIDVQNQVNISESLDAFDKLSDKLSGGFFTSGNLLQGGLFNQLESVKEEIETLNALDLDDSGAQLKLINIQQQIANTYDEIRGQILSVSTAVAELNGELVDSNLTASIQSFLQNLDFGNLNNDELQKFSYELGNITSQLQDAFTSNNSTEFDALGDSLNTLAERTDNFDPKLNAFTVSIEDLNRQSNLTTIPIDTLGQGIEQLGSDVVGAEDSISSLTNATEEYASVAERLAGVSESNLESVSDLIFQYDQLTLLLGNLTDQQIRDLQSKTNLTSEEKYLVDILNQRSSIMAEIATAYPSLLSQDVRAVSLSAEKRAAIIAENEANKNLLEGYKLARDGKLSSEQQSVLASAQGTKARIENIKAEIQALILLQRQQKAVATEGNNNVLLDTNGESGRNTSQNARNIASRISTYEVELSELQALYNSTTNSIGGFVTALNSQEKSTKSGTSQSKASSQQRKEETYVTDKYAQAISDLNLQIEKQQKLRQNLNEFDEAYQASLRREIQLEQQKLQLQRNQASELQRQINVGSGGQKVVDETRESLNRLQSEILSSTEAITKLGNELVNAVLGGFENSRQVLDRSFNVDSSILQNTNRYTSQYNDLLDHQISILQRKQGINQKEVDFLNSQIFSGKLTSQQLSELTGRFTDLQATINGLNTEIGRLELDKLGVFQDAQTQNSRLVEYYDEILTTLVKGTEDYTYAQNKSREATRNLINEQQKELNALIELATSGKISGEVFNDITARTQELTLSINKLNYELVNADVQEAKQALDEIYNNYVETYKRAVEERKKDTLRTIEAERKAEQDAYNARVKRLNDELNLFRKNANERLALIDREEAQRGYDENINSSLQQRNDLQSQIDRLALDNSREGIARRARLIAERDTLDEEIAKQRRDRDIELQKEAINQNIEDKENEINTRLDLEEQAYNTVIDRIDRQKEYYEQYYNDLLNDERKFARIREEIASGNLDNIANEFGDFITDLTSTIPEIENTFDGTLQAVGTSIRLNVIDSLNEALKLISQFNSSSLSSVATGGALSGSTGNSFTTQNTLTNGYSSPLENRITNGDQKVLLGKYLREQLVNATNDQTTKGFIVQKGDRIAAEGRSEGSTISPYENLTSVLSNLNREDLQNLSRFFISQSSSIVDTPSLQQNIRSFGQRIASLDTGGFINSSGLGVDGKGGRFGILHPQEVVLDKVDTKALISGINVLDRVTPMLSRIGEFFRPNNSEIQTGYGNITVEFTGTINTPDLQQADNFATRFVQGIRNKGGKI